MHGGSFIFEGSGSHFRLVVTYTKETCCKVVYTSPFLFVIYHICVYNIY